MWPYTAEESRWYDTQRAAGYQTLPEIDAAEMRRLIARGRRMQSAVVCRMTRNAARTAYGLPARALAAARRAFGHQVTTRGAHNV